jgi:hypothetical protein
VAGQNCGLSSLPFLRLSGKASHGCRKCWRGSGPCRYKHATALTPLPPLVCLPGRVACPPGLAGQAMEAAAAQGVHHKSYLNAGAARVEAEVGGQCRGWGLCWACGWRKSRLKWAEVWISTDGCRAPFPLRPHSKLRFWAAGVSIGCYSWDEGEGSCPSGQQHCIACTLGVRKIAVSSKGRPAADMRGYWFTVTHRRAHSVSQP